MRYRSLAATAASAGLLALTPSSAAANHFPGDCTRTKSLTTCVQTSSELQLLQTSYYGYCENAYGAASRLQTERYATVETTEITSYRKHKILSQSVLYAYSDEYTTELHCP